MEKTKVIAQIKAFQNYLTKFVDSIKSESQDENFGKVKAEFYEVCGRYEKLRRQLQSLYPNEFADLVDSTANSLNNGIKGLEQLSREIGYVLDTIVNLEDESTSNQSDFKPNNKPFTKDEVQIINNQLDDLQTKLIETLNKQNLSQEKIVPLIESVKSEIGDLKAEAANTKLGRKDWKILLINTMINLTFYLSFSQEARNTIFIYFQSLFVYLQPTVRCPRRYTKVEASRLLC